MLKGMSFLYHTTSMKFSRRDLLLFIGILVAVVITLTTLAHREPAAAAKVKKEILPQKKTASNT